MRLTELSGKKIAILGFGKEGQAVLEALREHGVACEVTALDSRADLRVEGVAVRGGPDYLKSLTDFDVIVRSPGIPPQPEFAAVAGRLVSGTQIFLDSIAGTGALVIGVTGSKGKSTTSTLIYEVLKAAGRDAHLVGNIGKPALAHLAAAKPGAIFVHEFSSYQLADLTVSPPIAVVTAFFPEHLDYHGSLEAYREAKGRIARFQTENDVVFYNAKFPDCAWIAEQGRGEKVPFSDADSPVTLAEIKLLGRHNLGNIGAVTKVITRMDVPLETAIGVFREFRGLPHRLQDLGVHHGIRWIDDAISTTPDSAAAALDALGDGVETMILGGQDRGVDFSLLGARLAGSSVRHAILFPGSGPRIRQAIEAAGAEVTFDDAVSMEEAVRLAKERTGRGKICLLSTASPSYGMFKNFEEKGDAFRRCIEA